MVLARIFTTPISGGTSKPASISSRIEGSPTPDPFAFTTAGAGEAYPGEAITRRFNLTHEWLAQVVLYLVWRATGFGGVVLFRALILVAFCGLIGVIAWRRCGGFYRSLAAACAAGGMAIRFALDRPFSVTMSFPFSLSPAPFWSIADGSGCCRRYS